MKFIAKDGYVNVDESIGSYKHLESKIDEEYNSINESKTLLKQFAVCRPADVCDETEDPIYAMNSRVDDTVDNIIECAENIGRYNVLIGICDDWKYSENSKVDTETSEGFKKITVPDEHNFNLWKFNPHSLSVKKFISVDDLFNTAFDNNCNNFSEDKKYVFYWKGKRFTTDGGICIFDTIEEGYTALLDSMDISADIYEFIMNYQRDKNEKEYNVDLLKNVLNDEEALNEFDEYVKSKSSFFNSTFYTEFFGKIKERVKEYLTSNYITIKEI